MKPVLLRIIEFPFYILHVSLLSSLLGMYTFLGELKLLQAFPAVELNEAKPTKRHNVVLSTKSNQRFLNFYFIGDHNDLSFLQDFDLITIAKWENG